MTELSSASLIADQLEERLKEIGTVGFTVLENVFPDSLLEKVNQCIEDPMTHPMINGRKGYVKKGHIRYLYAALSWAKEIISIYTHPDIIRLADAYAGDVVHLSNYRIYRTFPSWYERMQWHVDNKIDIAGEEKGKYATHMTTEDKGLIMIMYLSDVHDGGLQIVKGSHQWAFKEEKENWDDREQKFKKDIVTFNDRKRGTIILYDYRCIHRSKPYRGGSIRTSLFGQYTPSALPVGEPILLSTEDTGDLTDTQKRVLNFGKTPTYENWPIGSPGEVLDDIGFPMVGSFLFVQAKKILKMMGFFRKKK